MNKLIVRKNDWWESWLKRNSIQSLDRLHSLKKLKCLVGHWKPDDGKLDKVWWEGMSLAYIYPADGS